MSYNLGKMGAPAKSAVACPATLSRAAEVLGELRGDGFTTTVALQEVTSEQDLRQLALQSGYQNAVFVATNDPTNHHLGFLSTGPLEDLQSHVDRTFLVAGQMRRFTRDVASVGVEVLPGQKGRFYNSHLKADPWYLAPTTPEKKALAVQVRGAEAAELKQIVLEDMQRFQVEHHVVGLDANAPPQAEELKTLPGIDPLAPEVASHPGRGIRLDALRLSAILAGGVAAAFVHDSAAARLASDHLPVVVDLGSAHPVAVAPGGESFGPAPQAAGSIGQPGLNRGSGQIA